MNLIQVNRLDAQPTPAPSAPGRLSAEAAAAVDDDALAR